MSAYKISCYKDLTHAGQLKRAETGTVVPIKRGRRSIDEKSSQIETDGSIVTMSRKAKNQILHISMYTGGQN